MGQHALLSPSAAHRWLHCTAAPRLEADVEDKGSEFAEEGSLAHAYCAKKLKTFLGLPVDGEDEEIEELNERYHSGEMDEYTDTYVTIVLEKFNAARKHTPDAQLLVETRLDFTEFAPESFGTADAIIIADGMMEVIDFKYGKGVRVDAVENPQMMIYALGAVSLFGFEYRIDSVKMTIVQPRIDNLSEYQLPADELLKWAEETLKPKAREAFDGEGEQEPGEWCRFCKIKHRCKALAAKSTETVEANPDPRLLSREDMEILLPLLDTIKTWLSGVEEYCLQQALDGVQYSGYKIVEGRSVRKITDQQAVIKLLTDAGFSRDAVIRPTELRTITDLEKLIGKKRFSAICADYIIKPQGKPTLVPESDKRPAMNSAADDFSGVNV